MKKIVIAVFIVAAVLFAFSPARAATIEQLQAQINALIAQISALQQELAKMQQLKSLTNATVVSGSFRVGQTVNIKWTQNLLDKVSILLIDSRGSSAYKVIALNVPASQGYFNWTIPTTGINLDETGSAYTIWIGEYAPSAQSGSWASISGVANAKLHSQTMNFGITSNSTVPHITSVSPTEIGQGQTQTVTFSGYNLGTATNTMGNCGLNPMALGGFLLGNCVIQDSFVKVDMTAATNSTTGTRLFTISTPSGVSNSISFSITLRNSSTEYSEEAIPSTSLRADNVNVLYRYKVKANGNNPAVISGETFLIKQSGVKINQLRIFEYADVNRTQFIDSISWFNEAPLADGVATSVIFNNGIPVTIPAGQTRYFDVRAVVETFKDGGYITTSSSIFREKTLTSTSPSPMPYASFTCNPSNCIAVQGVDKKVDFVNTSIGRQNDIVNSVWCYRPAQGQYGECYTTKDCMKSELKPICDHYIFATWPGTYLMRLTVTDRQGNVNVSEKYFSVVKQNASAGAINQMANLLSVMTDLAERLTGLK